MAESLALYSMGSRAAMASLKGSWRTATSGA